MLKEILRDSKSVIAILTQAGLAVVLLVAIWIIGQAIIQGFNNIAIQMENSNAVLQGNSTALTANTEATKQMNALLLQVLGNKSIKAGMINSIKEIAKN